MSLTRIVICGRRFTTASTAWPLLETPGTSSGGGFFSKAVVLVEGVTESLALPLYFEKAALDVAHMGVAVIPVQRKGNLAKWKRFFEFYGIPCFVIFDNDAQNDEQGTKRRDALLSLGIVDEDTEGLITTTD